ncbi:GbsR/MarR family transcriptional regulator [Streptomyces sp. KLOTTS4A1]|uniref:GbsR/MarR family transcriptional regulator n=1 Tax=Streptomyces sp. KLOTTS4A1 TaxID=3390996 RepID=UPI0039F595EC
MAEASEPHGADAAWSDFVEKFAAQLVEAGMPRMPSRVFAGLLASDSGVMTSAELGEALQVSPAAVSGAIRYLSQVRMVSREREPGSRRERYRVHSSTWYEALTNREAILKRWEATLREGISTLGPETEAGRRIAETLEFFTFLDNELSSLMDRWQAHKAQVFGAG